MTLNHLDLYLPQFPDSQIFLTLYTNVTNASTIRSNLLSGNTKYSYAFLDPKSIVSISHVLAAVYRALTERAAGSMRTRTVNSEIVFSMSPSMSIGDGLKRFGSKDDSTSILVVRLFEDEDKCADVTQVLTALDEIVDGDRIPISDSAIEPLTDIEIVRKVIIPNPAFIKLALTFLF